jgi:hypothetical protein
LTASTGDAVASSNAAAATPVIYFNIKLSLTAGV